MSTKIRRILVAIRDLRHAPRNELRKAAALARRSGARIELFHAIEEPDPGRSYPETITRAQLRSQRAQIVERAEARLERFARTELPGLKVSWSTSFEHPAYHAVVRRALRSRADLVIAATRGHRFGARLVLRNVDWELIRHCAVPLLLVKSRRPYRRPVILAAVDPFHIGASASGLDARLLDAARQFAQLLHGTTLVFHAYMPLVMAQPSGVGAAPLMMMPPAVEEAHGEEVVRTIERLASRAGIARGRCQVCMGEVADELSALARRTRADLVVMGAMSRSALARLFIGNTAEHVLDRLSCDVLVVKPPGFRARGQ